MEKSYLFPLFLGIWQVFTLYFSMLGAHKEEENPRFSISPSSANDDPTRGEGTEGPEEERDRGNFLFSP